MDAAEEDTAEELLERARILRVRAEELFRVAAIIRDQAQKLTDQAEKYGPNPGSQQGGHGEVGPRPVPSLRTHLP